MVNQEQGTNRSCGGRPFAAGLPRAVPSFCMGGSQLTHLHPYRSKYRIKTPILLTSRPTTCSAIFCYNPTRPPSLDVGRVVNYTCHSCTTNTWSWADPSFCTHI